MDKLAPAIAWTKENGFWLANGLLLLLMIGLWFLVTGSLNEDKDKNLSKIKKETSLVQQILRKKPEDLTDPEVSPLHPNRSTQEGMKAELERTVNSIIEAWELRVKIQKELLVFPEEIGNEEFARVFAPYNPPEKFPEKYADITTINPLLQLYRDNIPYFMINICREVRTNWRKDPEIYPQDEDRDNAARQGLGGYDDYDDQPVLDVSSEDASRFAVIWSAVNQQLWYDKLTKFQGRDDHDKENKDPTPLQAYMLQQDLWVLQAMFQVIKKLNGDSTATDTSAIKRIDHIGIGREGSIRLGKLLKIERSFAPEGYEPPVASSASTAGAESGYGGGAGYGGDNGGYGTDGTGSSANDYAFPDEDAPLVAGDSEYDTGVYDDPNASTERFPPFHELYVDTNYEPISAEQVLAVVNGEELPESNLELLIAKRLPVRIGLKMDERKIPNFMAACIDSPFSFEIQQVRINRHKPNGEFIALGGGEVLGGYNNNLLDDESDKFDEVSNVEKRTNFDVNVEFFGIVKIYNPVRADLIRKAAGLEPEPTDDNPSSLDSAATRDSSAAVRTAG